jgi:YbbR domain-containing protein
MRDGINKVEPKEVEVYVKMVPAKTKLIQKVPLQVIGVGNRLKANIITPAGGSIDITLSGAPSLLGKIDVSNIKAYLDVSNLPAGNHEVPIRFNLPSYIQVKGQNELKATVQLSS